MLINTCLNIFFLLQFTHIKNSEKSEIHKYAWYENRKCLVCLCKPTHWPLLLAWLNYATGLTVDYYRAYTVPYEKASGYIMETWPCTVHVNCRPGQSPNRTHFFNQSQGVVNACEQYVATFAVLTVLFCY